MIKFTLQYNCKRCGDRFQQTYPPPAADITTIKQVVGATIKQVANGKFERDQWHKCCDGQYGLLEIVGFNFDDSTLTTEDEGEVRDAD